MIGSLSLLRHQDQHDVATFRNHWLNVHGPAAAILPGVRRYAQSHFLPDHPLTTELARTFNVDGLAAMSFNDEDDRELCYSSHQEEVCDVDSLLFIGATARYVSDVDNIIVAKSLPAPAKAVFLFLSDSADPSHAVKRVAEIKGITGLIAHVITKPGAIPFQPRAQIELPLRAMIEVSADTFGPIELARDILVAVGMGKGVAVFAAKEHSIIG